MKYKKIMLVSLFLLAVLTIGAVSAVEDTVLSDDNALTAENTDSLSQSLDDVTAEDTDSLSQSLDDDVTVEKNKADEGVKGSSYDASDFNVVINESMNLAAEDAPAVIFEVPEGAEGDIWIENNYSDSILAYGLDRSPLTLDDLDIESAGLYFINVTFAYDDDEGYTHQIELATATIEVRGSVSPSDFYGKKTYMTYVTHTGMEIFNMENCPADGEILALVDGVQVYNSPISEGDTISISDSDLGIMGVNGEYTVKVLFKTTDGYQITIEDFDVEVDVDSSSGDDDEEDYSYHGDSPLYIELNDEVDASSYYNYIAYISDEDYVNGTVKLYIDGTEYYNKELNGTKDYLFIYPKDLDGIDVFDSDFLGNHTVKVTYKDLSEENIVSFIFEPYFIITEISTEEPGYIIFKAAGDFNGNVSLYNASLNVEEDVPEMGANILDNYPISASLNVIPLRILTAGYHLFYINYTIDGINNDMFFRSYVSENSKNLTSSISASKVDVGGSLTLTVTSPKVGYLDFYLDGNYKSTYSMYNQTSVKEVFSNLTKGQHVVSVSYDNQDENDLTYNRNYLVYVGVDSNSTDSDVSTTDISTASLKLSKATFTYNAKVQKPTLTITNGVALKEGVDYTLQWSAASPKKVGTYTVTVVGMGDYAGTVKASFKIVKAANPLVVKAKTVKVKFTTLKKKAQSLAVSKVLTFSKKGQGTLTYAKVSGNGKISINKKTGKVTIKKGLKKGTYKIKMKVKALGNANYKASAYKTVTFKIIVK